MKVLKFITAITLLTVLSSCNDWLTISPKDQVDEEQLFETGLGYRNALNGIYQNMASGSMYGREMTWGVLDVLAQYYDSGELDNPWKHMAEKFNYDVQDSETLIDNIWSRAFNSIANANNLLSRIDDEDPLKFAGEELEKNVIKGEALALRAFLHFDMVRLFAPSKDDGRTYIPYFEKYPSTFEPRTTVNEVMEKVIRDLNAAKDLVAPYDTLDSREDKLHSLYRFNTAIGMGVLGVTDLFEAYRGFRMNYYAIQALLACAYAYIGRYQEAFDATQIVIDAKDKDLHKLFQFTSKSDLSKKPKLQDDLIFALSNEKLLDNYLEYYNGEYVKLYLDIWDKDDLFDDPADYRRELIAEVGYFYQSVKYSKTATGNQQINEVMIPMLRLSEMYYIRAEYYAHSSMFDKATSELDMVRRGRNCTIGRLDISSVSEFSTELINEAKREFVGEGQLWYYYKKLNIKPVRSMPDDAFIFPLPKSETIN